MLKKEVKNQAEECAFMQKKTVNGMEFRKCIALDKNYCVKCPDKKCKFFMDMDTYTEKTKRYNNPYGRRVLKAYANKT